MEVCESVEQCVKLVHIDLSYCYKLKKLPISLGKLQKVQTLLLNGFNLSESAIMDSSDLSISSQTSSSAIIREAMESDFKFFMTFLPQLTLIPPQPGLGYQHQLVPRMSSDGGPMSIFYRAMVPTCQQEARPDGSRVGVTGPQNHQQPLSLMQQQMVPFGLMYPHPPGSDAGNVLIASVPYDVQKAMHLRDTCGIFALTNASPTEKRTMSGEDQYPPLEQLEAESEATVTRDFFRLLKSPEVLKAKVADVSCTEDLSNANKYTNSKSSIGL